MDNDLHDNDKLENDNLGQCIVWCINDVEHKQSELANAKIQLRQLLALHKQRQKLREKLSQIQETIRTTLDQIG